MTVVNGYIYTKNVEDISELPYEKKYHAAIRYPTSWWEKTFGYKVIKLSKDVTWYEGWRPDDIEEITARKGEYLVQVIGQPPQIVKTWDELRSKYRVFRSNQKAVSTND